MTLGKTTYDNFSSFSEDVVTDMHWDGNLTTWFRTVPLKLESVKFARSLSFSVMNILYGPCYKLLLEAKHGFSADISVVCGCSPKQEMFSKKTPDLEKM